MSSYNLSSYNSQYVPLPLAAPTPEPASMGYVPLPWDLPVSEINYSSTCYVPIPLQKCEESSLALTQLPPSDASTHKIFKRKLSPEREERSSEPKRVRRTVQEPPIDFCIVDSYQNVSFLEKEKLDFSKEDTRLSEAQWKIVTALIQHGHPSTFQALQEEAGFRRALKQWLARDSLPAEQVHLREALREFENYPPSFKAQKGFLKTLLVRERVKESITGEENLNLAIQSGSLSPSRHYSDDFVKIKGKDSPHSYPELDLPYTIALDRTTGKMVFVQNKLNHGGFKTVKRFLLFGEDPANSRLLVMGKQIHQLNWARQEIEFIERCRGEQNVIQLLEHYTYTNKAGQCVQVTMAPLYERGDLFHFVESKEFATLSPPDQLAIARDIIRGTMNLHKHSIIHCDLKPENIFLTYDTDETGRERVIALIGDLGLAYDANNPEATKKGIGTLQFAPPERLEGKMQGAPGDAWAIGVILSLCFHNCYPYLQFNNTAENLHRQIYEASKALQNVPSPKKGTINWIIWGLTRPDLNDRLSLKEALEELDRLNGV